MFSLPVLIARGLDLQYAGCPLYLPSLFSFQGVSLKKVGVFNGEGPPVPIPNTEVKLTSAENTCLATDREDRSMPTQTVWRKSSRLIYASLAQPVEHAAVNRRAVGSNPTGGATRNGIAATISWRQSDLRCRIGTVSSVGRAAGS